MAEIFAVFVRLGKFLVVISLAATLGAHWALLQTVAWTTMLADNLRTHSLSESVERTFDGKYPCPICKAIAEGKKSEKQNVFALQLQKQEFPPAGENSALFAPSNFQLLPQANTFADSLTQKPLTPPPREFFV
jgi:hypothetical protein